MIYFNYALYIHQEKSNYILWYIKNTTTPAFLYKTDTKGKDQEEQDNILSKCLTVHKAHCE